MSRFNVLSEDHRRIGLRIVHLRRVDEIPQAQLARDMGLTINRLANIETGRVALPSDIGWQLCCYFVVNPLWLCTGQGREYFADEFGDKKLRAIIDDFIQRNASIPLLEVWPGSSLQIQILKKQLTSLSESVKFEIVKPQLPALLERLKSATKQKGKKTELAADLNVPLASISQWLSGEREPGGEYTLKLLKWVEWQEEI